MGLYLLKYPAKILCSLLSSRSNHQKVYLGYGTLMVQKITFPLKIPHPNFELGHIIFLICHIDGSLFPVSTYGNLKIPFHDPPFPTL